jgi:hypothetical protein
MLQRPPSLAAARARRRERWRVAKATCHERARRGERCGRFRYDAVALDFLIANQWLAECDADNAKAIGDAVTGAAVNLETPIVSEISDSSFRKGAREGGIGEKSE